MRFTKMNGAGNDYVFVYQPREGISDPVRTAIRVSDRHFGIGSDGLVLIDDSTVADAKMRIFNADGSEGRMCGNAIRCVARYLYERGLVQKEEMRVETLSGIKRVWLISDKGMVSRVRVDMGAPERIEEGDFRGTGVTYVDVGNPHAVLFLDPQADGTYETLKAISQGYPGGINAEAVKVVTPERLSVRVYERGSGETLACGTGACAATYATLRQGKCRNRVTVELKGGEIEVEYDRGRLYMTGDAAVNFEGVYDDGKTES